MLLLEDWHAFVANSTHRLSMATTGATDRCLGITVSSILDELLQELTQMIHLGA
jgi:hypothetical protein